MWRFLTVARQEAAQLSSEPGDLIVCEGSSSRDIVIFVSIVIIVHIVPEHGSTQFRQFLWSWRIPWHTSDH